MRVSLGLSLSSVGAPLVDPPFGATPDTSSNILSSTPANYTIMFGTDTGLLYVYVVGDGWSIYTP